jgi:hydrophobic/amphiphilic exporter-1 (mainly G- bacteria), HAE1 family
MNFARLELSERLGALEEDLPRAATRPEVTPYVPAGAAGAASPLPAYTVTGPRTLEALRDHVERTVIPELVRLDGVADVQAMGGRARLLEIELDDSRARRRSASPRTPCAGGSQELEYVREAGVVQHGGLLHALAIRHRAESADEVRRLPLLTDRGRLVRLGDVATVRDTREEPRAHYRIDGQPAVSFTVYREQRTNAVAVADRVKAHLAEAEPLHPAGVRLILDADESEAIRTQLSDLRVRALIAAAVIFLVLLLFLRSLRSAGIVFATIAFSILITLNLLYWGGLSLNVLTLMGLAMGFGLIVDNAIVVLENIYRHRYAGSAAEEAAERGAREVVLPCSRRR